ncbi:MAG: hypothetical protein FWF57_08890 [Defluviitaleaceae bacterium]|nr:hypothetical protein [Defluviitaleaceae bacterium]
MLTLYVVSPILLAVFMYLFTNDKAAKIIAILAQLALIIASFNLFLQARTYTVSETVGNYYSVTGIRLNVDGLSSILILLTTLIFLTITIYNFAEKKSKLFWLLMFIWEGSLIGIFMTGDFFNRFVLMEVSTIISTILIMYNRKHRSLYDGLYYLIINVISVQFYLLGVGYLYRLTGTLDIYEATYRIPHIDPSLLVLPYALIMTFAALKCALIPMTTWVPKALATAGAPPTVLAVMSTVQMTSGIYLFIRMHYVFGDFANNAIFAFVGASTSIVGIFMAISQKNIRHMLSYLAVVQFGLIIFGLNTGDEYSRIGTTYHMINNAIAMAALFLGTGIIIEKYQTKDLDKIQGVLKSAPITSYVLIFAFLSIFATPFLNGSVSKQLIIRDMDILGTIIMYIISLGSMVIFFKFSSIFFGKSKIEESESETLKMEIQEFSIIPLGLLCILGGIFSREAIGIFFNAYKSINIAENIQHGVIFVISIVIAFFINKLIKKDTPILKKLQTYDMGIRGIILSVGLFFAFILLIVGF